MSVLDDFLKLVRSNHSAKVLRHHPPPPNVSPLSFRGSASDGASKGASGSGSGKKPWDSGSGIIIRLSLPPRASLLLRQAVLTKENPKTAASPVSRNLARNPIIYNSQFGLVPEES